MTNGEMIQTVKDNLGNRNSGRIGGRDIDTVVLEALNLAVPHCVQEAQPDYYNRTAEIAMVVGTREYDLPTVDTEGDPLKIKNIYGYRCTRGGGTDVNVQQLNFAEFVKRTSNYKLNYTGTPHYFALWGKNNRLTFDYFPSESMTLTLYVEAYPQVISALSLNSALPVDDQWNIVVEAFATKHCFLKLQQSEMYLIWEKLYDDQKASITRDENVKQGENIYQGYKTQLITDPALDPRIRRWNS